MKIKKRVFLLLLFAKYGSIFAQNSQNTLPVSGSTQQVAKEISNAFEFLPPQSVLGRFSIQQLYIAKRLHLSEGQFREFDVLNDDFVTRIAVLHEDKAMDKKERKKQIKTLKKDRKKAFLALLTPQQQEKYSKMQKKKAMKKAIRKANR